MSSTQEVVLVPGKHRALLADLKNVRIQDVDGSTWVSLTDRLEDCLWHYLKSHSSSKSWKASHVSRLGWNNEGVYHHHDHMKRYFGLLRSQAPEELSADVPEAVPMFSVQPEEDTLLDKMRHRIPDVTDELRCSLLTASFNSADINQNGYISKQELGALMRKLVYSISNRDLEALLADMDSNDDGKIDYREFSNYVTKTYKGEVATRLRRILGTDADLIKGSFRIFDRNGNGQISPKEMRGVLEAVGISRDKANILIDVMDQDDDGLIDYDEFVTFLFKLKPPRR